ncbi:MAG: hypothetical protein IPN17_38745 [Deltaproteobacteria bacterium]|nr:hypothetical protein [Deltaproteobacteria bacterium]
MQRAIIVRGHLVGPRLIELDESVGDLVGEVEVVVRPWVADAHGGVDVFEFIASLPPGNRERDDIDRQVAEERASWGDR